MLNYNHNLEARMCNSVNLEVSYSSRSVNQLRLQTIVCATLRGTHRQVWRNVRAWKLRALTIMRPPSQLFCLTAGLFSTSIAIAKVYLKTNCSIEFYLSLIGIYCVHHLLWRHCSRWANPAISDGSSNASDAVHGVPEIYFIIIIYCCS